MTQKKLNTELNGIAPSLHTPFDNNNSIDFKSLRRLLDHTINSGCSGMLVGAVAGENQYLSQNEKIKLMDYVLSYVDKQIPVIVACTAQTQRERISLVKTAKSLGAEWYLVQSPKKLSKVKILDIFQEISENGPKKLMIQDLSWNDNGLTDDVIINLFNKIPNFIALKIEVINSGLKYSRVLEMTKNNLHLSGGWAVASLIESLKRGVHSFIPSAMERFYVKIYNLAKQGKYNEARIIFEKILPVISFSHQQIDISIRFFKMLRVKEKIFDFEYCRGNQAKLDKFQVEEAKLLIDKLIKEKN